MSEVMLSDTDNGRSLALVRESNGRLYLRGTDWQLRDGAEFLNALRSKSGIRPTMVLFAGMLGYLKGLSLEAEGDALRVHVEVEPVAPPPERRP